MLNQAAGIDKSCKTIKYITHQLSYVTNSNEGEGLLLWECNHSFVDVSKDTLLYSIMTTKPEEVQGEEGV